MHEKVWLIWKIGGHRGIIHSKTQKKKDIVQTHWTQNQIRLSKFIKSFTFFMVKFEIGVLIRWPLDFSSMAFSFQGLRDYSKWLGAISMIYSKDAQIECWITRKIHLHHAECTQALTVPSARWMNPFGTYIIWPYIAHRCKHICPMWSVRFGHYRWWCVRACIQWHLITHLRWRAFPITLASFSLSLSNRFSAKSFQLKLLHSISIIQ